jgi:hypothetical protein
MKKMFWLLLPILVCIFLTGCSNFNDNTNIEIQKISEDGNGNFILYVSNQSFAINPIDIKIYIDDMVAVNEDFDVGIQHTWKPFQFNLPTGTHSIKIESIIGDSILEENFDIIDDKHWALVQYWYYPEKLDDENLMPKHFSFDIKNEPYFFK